MQKKFFLIAHYAVTTMLHEKLFQITVILLLCGAAFAFFLTTLSITDTTKIYIDCMLALFQVGILATTIISIVPFFTKEKDILGIFVTHGVARPRIFYGCATGIYTMVLSMNLLLWLLMLIILYLQTGFFFTHLWPLFLIYTLQPIYLVSVGLLWSLVLSTALARVTTLIWYMLSFLIHPWYSTLEQSPHTATRIIVFMLYHLVPDFALLDIQPQIMYQLPLATAPIVHLSVYIVCYSLILLTVAGWRFCCSKLY